MRGLAAGVMLVLAGCAAGYRNTSVPITSIAAFDPDRFAGRWYEVARYPVPFEEDCKLVSAELEPVGGGYAVDMFCHFEGVTGPGRLMTGRLQAEGAARYRLELPGEGYRGEFWVLWVDESYRTAVIGQPGGGAGWILNRDTAIPLDRLRAAREILDWNGYDLEALIFVNQGGPL